MESLLQGHTDATLGCVPIQFRSKTAKAFVVSRYIEFSHGQVDQGRNPTFKKKRPFSLYHKFKKYNIILIKNARG